MSDDIEQKRHDCEVRDVAARPLWQRRMYLDQVEQSRGKVAADKLRAALTALWDARDAKAAV